MSKNRNLADLLDSTGDVKSDALDNVSGLPDAIDVNASAPADSLNIDSSGNIGIGTTSPNDGTLHIHNNASNIHFTNSVTGSTSSDGLFFGLGGSATDAYFWNRESNSLRFGTSNTERMRIDSSGDVYVGGTTIASADNAVYSATTAKAFINFTQIGTQTISRSFGISSISDTGTGATQINFSTAFATAFYCSVTGLRRSGTRDMVNLGFNRGTSSDVIEFFSNDSMADSPRIYIAYFHD